MLIDQFVSRRLDDQLIFDSVPALALIGWSTQLPPEEEEWPTAQSPDFKLQALFRPLLTADKLSVQKGSTR